MCDSCNAKSREINRLKGVIRGLGTLYCLFQTDTWQSKDSAVLFGVYSTKEAAIDEAKKNGLYTHEAEVVIREITLDDFAGLSGVF